MKKTIIYLLLCTIAMGVHAQEREDIKMLKQEAAKGNLVSIQTLAQHYQYKQNPDIPEAVKWHEMAANAGDFEAVQTLASIYSWYFKDEAKSNYWLGRASDMENAETGTYNTFNLAFRYFNGIGSEVNPTKAIELWKKCSKLGDGTAMFWIGCCHFYGVGTEKDIHQALKWFNEAASYSSADAMNAIAYCQFNGIGTAKKPQQAVSIYQSVLPYNHALAMRNLAYCMEHGIGIAQNKTEAANLYFNAVNYIYPEKTNKIDANFEIGEQSGGQANYANTWLEKAVSLGHQNAIVDLAIRYDNEKNYTKAFKYFQMAANKGNKEALAMTGRYYASGKGVEKDAQKALQIFRQAGDNLSLGKCYQSGNGVEKDLNKAIEHLLKVTSNMDMPEAFLHLGQCYEEIGDYANAYKNYKDAGAWGNHDGSFKAGQLCENGKVAAEPYEAVDYYLSGAAYGHLSCVRALQRCYTKGIGVEPNAEKVKNLKKAVTMILTGNTTGATSLINSTVLP